MVILCVWISGDIESFGTHKILWNCGVCVFFLQLFDETRPKNNWASRYTYHFPCSSIIYFCVCVNLT